MINSHENGKHLVSTALDKEQTKQDIQSSKKVQDFKKAYKNEIYYEEDMKISTEKNGYKKLNLEEKKMLEDFEAGFVK
jgi:hypothetical protein